MADSGIFCTRCSYMYLSGFCPDHGTSSSVPARIAGDTQSHAASQFPFPGNAVPGVSQLQSMPFPSIQSYGGDHKFSGAYGFGNAQNSRGAHNFSGGHSYRGNRSRRGRRGGRGRGDASSHHFHLSISQPDLSDPTIKQEFDSDVNTSSRSKKRKAKSGSSIPGHVAPSHQTRLVLDAAHITTDHIIAVCDIDQIGIYAKMNEEQQKLAKFLLAQLPPGLEQQVEPAQSPVQQEPSWLSSGIGRVPNPTLPPPPPWPALRQKTPLP